MILGTHVQWQRNEQVSSCFSSCGKHAVHSMSRALHVTAQASNHALAGQSGYGTCFDRARLPQARLDLLERIDAMAFVALPAECAFVHIVFIVATDTRRRQLRLAGHRLAVTAIAIPPLMSALQPEAGAGVVIEVPQAPTACVVTAFALRAQAALMHVILVVTRQAFRFGDFVLRRGMTFPAFHRHVFAQQRETGAAVIESGFFPVLRAMALLALLTLLAFVHVVLFMTGDAGDRRIFVFPVFVARVALHLAVLAQQAKARFAVIKAVFLPVAFAMTVTALVAQ